MTKRIKMQSSMVLLGLMVLAGCASEVAKKPEVSSSSTARGQAPGGKNAQTSPRESSASSLDAHREGKSPAAGPLKEIYFDFDSYDLKAAARVALKASAAWLKANPAARVEIEGHCDERGTTEYNLALGAKRASAAHNYLVSLGVSPARLSTRSFGEELPVCKEKTEQCYQKNRRDRFVVSGVRPTS